MTVLVFFFLLAGNTVTAGWHMKEFLRHAVNRRAKPAQLVLFTGPLGWVAFCGREWRFIPLHVAAVLVWIAVAGTLGHLLAIWSQVTQRAP